MNCARQHTDQVHDSGETPETLERKLRLAGYREPVLPKMTPAEARAKSLIAADQIDGRCSNCPCEGMGAIAAAFLLGLGTVGGVVLTLILKG